MTSFSLPPPKHRAGDADAERTAERRRARRVHEVKRTACVETERSCGCGCDQGREINTQTGI